MNTMYPHYALAQTASWWGQGRQTDSEVHHDSSDSKKGPDVEPPAPEFDPNGVKLLLAIMNHYVTNVNHYLFRSAQGLQHVQRLFQSHLLISASSLN